MDEINIIEAPSVDDDVMLPDGWTADNDIFDTDSWFGSSVDAQEDNAAEEDGTEGDAEADLTTESAEEIASEAETEVPAEEPTKPAKLKFRARVDHMDQDVELDEAELPSLYQKAQVTERSQAKMAAMSKVNDQAVRVARTLGYKNVEEMLDALQDSYRETEEQRLVREGVHEELAKDMVARRMKEAGATEAVADEATPGERNFETEVTELLKVRPQLAGKTLPNEVVMESLKSGKTVLMAYLEYENQQREAEVKTLRSSLTESEKERKTLKRNAEAASRAPVRGVSGGGATDTNPEDDFVRGFNSDGW